ncbi:MAG: ATP-binding protein [Bacillota bacterium]|nr:ATP-binding protein [Bacillota bacterium]MDW7684218.1 ATP-binding protein [Bacillota bacterium]
MNKRPQLQKLADSERWTHFLESTAIGLQLNLTLLFPDSLKQVQAPAKCTVCGRTFPELPTAEAEKIISLAQKTPVSSEDPLMIIHPLRDGLMMVARDCHCNRTKWCPSIEERAELCQRLLASFQTALTESISGGQRATELSAIRQMNQIVLSLFQGSSNATARSFDLILSALIILTEGQGSWLEYEWDGKEVLLSKGNEKAVSMFISKKQGQAETTPLMNKLKHGRLGVLSPADHEQAASILSLFAQECVIIAEIAELFELLQDYFGQVLGSICSAVLLVNRHHKVLYANAAAADMLGSTAQELLGIEVTGIEAPWNASIHANTRHLAAGNMDPLGPGDSRRWIDWQVCPMYKAETLVGWVILADDRTDYYNWHEAGRRAERLALTASLVGSLAHELRNPLSAAKGLLQLSGRKRDPEKTASYNDLILRELDRVTRLLNDFLLLGRTEHHSEDIIEPAAFITELLPLLEGETVGSDVEIVTEFGNVSQISFDQGQFTQVLLNLTRNAVDASGLQGQVTLRLSQEKEQVLIEVEDQGPGIPDAAFEKLFQPFFTTKERGTGLGLAVTQSIVHCNGGEISAKNAENGGAIFSVVIPAYVQKSVSSIKVMIISDDELLRYPVKRILSKAGICAAGYADMDEALALEHSISPAVILHTSLTRQIALKIKKHWPDAKTIAIDHPDNITRLPDVSYIHKPLDYAHLISYINEVLAENANKKTR